MTPKQLAQRQLAPIRTGLYVRAASGQRLRDRKVGRLVHKLQVVMPWLATADEPACRAWAQLEVLSTLAFAELRKNGIMNGRGEPVRMLDEYRKLRAAQLRYEYALGMTPASRKELLGALEQRDAVSNFHAYVAARDARKARG